MNNWRTHAVALLPKYRTIEWLHHLAGSFARCFKSYTEQRLAELQQLQSQPTLSNQELTRLVRANRDNLSHLAHELKTPLTSIVGYADLFLRLQRKDRVAVKDSYANIEHIERVLSGGRHLLHSIDDALEISRYKAGQMQLQPATVDIRELMSDLVAMMEPRHKRRNSN